MRNWLAISVVVILLDQLTKGWVQSAFAFGEHRSVTAFLDLVLFYNAGAAFSFLANAGGWQRIFFSVFALIASGIIVHLLRKHPGRKLFCLALSLILGGALGNLWDRVMLGHVVDFLYFHYHAYYWPAFNVADSAITLGAALLLWDGLKKPDR
ncbi:MAG TPA: signal peptidase II [Novimethylophilus sp.]|jgi:signal peptidase II|uniref:signal peptidase II n=1 Tax=Novimethylophilus sp. TaxID=2137426 RepID=UPI002F41598C